MSTHPSQLCAAAGLHFARPRDRQPAAAGVVCVCSRVRYTVNFYVHLKKKFKEQLSQTQVKSYPPWLNDLSSNIIKHGKSRPREVTTVHGHT